MFFWNQPFVHKCTIHLYWCADVLVNDSDNHNDSNVCRRKNRLNALVIAIKIDILSYREGISDKSGSYRFFLKWAHVMMRVSIAIFWKVLVPCIFQDFSRLQIWRRPQQHTHIHTEEDWEREKHSLYYTSVMSYQMLWCANVSCIHMYDH